MGDRHAAVLIGQSLYLDSGVNDAWVRHIQATGMTFGDPAYFETKETIATYDGPLEIQLGPQSRILDERASRDKLGIRVGHPFLWTNLPATPELEQMCEVRCDDGVERHARWHQFLDQTFWRDPATAKRLNGLDGNPSVLSWKPCGEVEEKC